jgi:hypothetical protein
MRWPVIVLVVSVLVLPFVMQLNQHWDLKKKLNDSTSPFESGFFVVSMLGRMTKQTDDQEHFRSAVRSLESTVVSCDGLLSF